MMSVVDILNKKHKVMNCVFEILYDLYGEPTWLKKPKDGQVPEKIIEQWINELGDYSENQLRQACYNLFKFKKVATFPKLAHILAELSDQPKEYDAKPESKGCRYMNLEYEFMQRDAKTNRRGYILTDYQKAIHYILNTSLKQAIGKQEYMTLEYSYRNDDIGLRSAKYRKARDLGLFDDFYNVLDGIVKERTNG